MLQQTQVATVIPYFERWMARFPDVRALAEASEQDVLSQWQGLGYYRRCRMLHRGAAWIAENGMPLSFSEWLQVPGVGRYTAGAIASIAFGERCPVVDGNVERVYSRLAADPSERPLLTRNAWAWAEANLQDDAGRWNQALMELGATICRPDPICSRCPVQSHCRALQQGDQSTLPRAKERPKIERIRLVTRAFVLCGDEPRFGLRRIQEGSWWAGMWQFPTASVFDGSPPCPQIESLGVLRHTVTNHRIELEVQLAIVSEPEPSLTWFQLCELQDLPLPSPQRRALEMVLKRLGRA